jgi:aryl-alcohol dehydrogenase-like predicted oxidoreductase
MDTSLPTAKLGLGTATFIPSYGIGGDSVVGSEALIHEAVVRGINYVDTAAGYAMSEETLGRMAEFLSDHDVRICTKMSVGSTETAEDSLRRLRVPRVDTLMMHSAGAGDLQEAKNIDRLLDARSRGQASRLGASTYGIDAASAALEQTWCETIQVEHSLLNPTVVPALAKVRRSGQEVVVRSVLCKGLLTSRRHQMKDLPAEAQELIDRLEARALEWGYSLSELAIRFALDTPGVDVVLVGLVSPAELAGVLRAATRPLTQEQWSSLAEFDCHDERWSHPELWRVAG